ncbi:MAG TPA: hypothetical protein VMO81_11805 [Aestuariivirgaceae bacterium]|nr:hypothetical protein [Aestuariivirgaceae bacterium]
MAKAWPKIPGKSPNSPGNQPPKATKPRPPERNKIYRKIGQVIVDAWKDAVAVGAAHKPLDRDHLQAEISKHLELVDPKGTVEIGVILDPKPDLNRKFIWIVIPYPDAPVGMTEQQWVQVYDDDDDDELKIGLGEAVLFGCGR